MNTEYLRWLRELKSDPCFIRFGHDLSYHRRDFLRGETPAMSAFYLIPW